MSVRIRFLFCVVSSVITSVTRADLDTSPYLLTEQSESSSGHFEWDEFAASAGFAGPHTPDVVDTGGIADITAAGVPSSPDSPPFGVVTSTENLYSLGLVATWTANLSGLTANNDLTTIVLQVSALGNLNDEELFLDTGSGEPIPPSVFVDRGYEPGVLHNIDDGPADFDTHHYWAAWENVDAASDYAVSWEGAHAHLSVSAARIDYFNTATPFSPVAPAHAVVDCDFDGDGALGLGDINMLLQEVSAETHASEFDIDADGAVDQQDIVALVEGANKLNSYIGDSNMDGQFGTGDLTTVFQAALFEDDIDGNASWETGDWNGDGDFGTGDLVFAFQRGGFEQGQRTVAVVPEPRPVLLALLGAVSLLPIIRRR